MDFLDPRTKIARRQKVILSYVLIGLLAIISAFVLLASSFGYGINTKTGQVIQNGLVFVTSNVPAHIAFNGVDTGKTASVGGIFPGPTRLALQSGDYKMSLSLEGYRAWSTTFRLASQQLIRLDYPLMIPRVLSPKSLAALPPASSITQSPSHRFIIVLEPSAQSFTAIRFDDNNLSAHPTRLVLPRSIAKISSNQWKVLGWSGDSSRVLVSHGVGLATEYIDFSLTSPNSFLRLTGLPSGVKQIEFRSGSTSQFVVLTSVGGFYIYDAVSHQSNRIAGSVTGYSQLRSDRIILSTRSSESASLIKIWDGTQLYKLTAVPGPTTPVATCSFGGHDYFILASASSNMADIYQDPLASIKAGVSVKVFKSLKIKSPTNIYVSPQETKRAVVVRSANYFASYDFETQLATTYFVNLPSSASVRAMDNYRLTSSDSRGYGLIWDSSGDNQYLLIPAQMSEGVFIGKSNKYMYSLAETSSGLNLYATGLLVAKPAE